MSNTWRSNGCESCRRSTAGYCAAHAPRLVTTTTGKEHIDSYWLNRIDRERAEALSAYKAELREKVEGLLYPTLHEDDANGNWWTLDMAYGWDMAQEAVLALLEENK